MINYDFNILQPIEFEWLTRDLLQAHFHFFVESFAPGKDGGIDLRFAYDKEHTCIIQCKRYEKWTDLKSILKKEANKVKSLNPSRYILSTSVNLNPNQKQQIIEILTPFIKAPADIFGRSDLNNLLSQHEDIQGKYYKLWLSSTNVLKKILHRDVYNWSDFTLETIQKHIKTYVKNDSFFDAMNLLNQNHYVIISGIPGIGKTTLAKMLALSLLSKDFKEFYYIVDDLNNAAKVFDKDIKQVFVFDDFLGSSKFEPQSLSFQNKLIDFISRIESSPNSRFILTTREYILSEAKLKYEKISSHNLEVSKCIIELSDYSKDIRASILYNHLYDLRLTKSHIKALLNERAYMKLITHKNFNPRVIEGFISLYKKNSIPAEEFMDSFISFFDKPLSVWDLSFSNLDNYSRYALMVFVTLGERTTYDKWRQAFLHFCDITRNQLNLIFDDQEWKKSLLILENSFVKKEIRYYQEVIAPINPSIIDFMIEKISVEPYSQKLLLRSVCYPEQLTSIFTDSIDNTQSSEHWVVLNVSYRNLILESFNSVWETIPSLCDSWDLIPSRIKLATNFLLRFPKLCKAFPGLVELKINSAMLFSVDYFSFGIFDLMKNVDWQFIDNTPKQVLLNIIESDFFDFQLMDKFLETAKAFNLYDFFDTSSYHSFFQNKLEKEIENIKEEIDCQYLNYSLQTLNHNYPNWTFPAVIKKINQKIDAMMSTSNKNKDDKSIEENHKNENENFPPRSDEEIYEMFTSLDM